MTAERPELAVSAATRRTAARLITAAHLARDRAAGLAARSLRNQHHYWQRSQLLVTDILKARPAVKRAAQPRKGDPGE